MSLYTNQIPCKTILFLTGSTLGQLRAARTKLKVPARKRNSYKGSDGPNWKGEQSINLQTGRVRAQAAFPVLGICQHCNLKPAKDRHHIDNNTYNNDPSNVALLCRKCHMIADGRLVALMKHLRHDVKPPRPCKTCECLTKIVRHGECPKCYEWRNRNGFTRPKNFSHLKK